MALKKKTKRSQRSGVILLLACFCLPALMGLMGLAVDASVVYSVKTKLQMAVDGAALAGLRSLSLSQNASVQSDTVVGMSKSWFYANFGNGYLGSTNTVLTDPALSTANSRNTVTVTGRTDVPTYFMKYWNANATTITATGIASRQDVNLMMVLDRSGSMDAARNTGTAPTSYSGGSPCAQMITAAKQFTGMFNPGLDNIGLITFSEAINIAYSPNTDFQNQLGYTNSAGSHSGALDNIICWGGTNTATAISMAWNELYKKQLPGAFNVILLFTDGKPTAGSFKFTIPASVDPTGQAQTAILSTSGCVDSTGKTIALGGDHINNPNNWVSVQGNVSSNVPRSGSGANRAISLGTNSYWNAFTGEIAALYSDGSSANGGAPMFAPNTPLTSYENTKLGSSDAPNCSFNSNANNYGTDIQFVPPTDLFGNPVAGYKSTSTTLIKNAQRISTGSGASNLSNVMVNLADNAAYWARNPVVGGNLVTFPSSGTPMAQTTVFVIGLGGNSGGVDHVLLQRLANDGGADANTLSGLTYTPVAGQPQGQYFYAPTAAQLQTAFASMGSSTMRLAQ